MSKHHLIASSALMLALSSPLATMAQQARNTDIPNQQVSIDNPYGLNQNQFGDLIKSNGTPNTKKSVVERNFGEALPVNPNSNITFTVSVTPTYPPGSGLDLSRCGAIDRPTGGIQSDYTLGGTIIPQHQRYTAQPPSVLPHTVLPNTGSRSPCGY